ncbi:MAG: FAD:protein FMN transferase [Azoarcus sp.]|nr:FAD:protein FMN transferase [Azoarcus sp.]
MTPRLAVRLRAVARAAALCLFAVLLAACARPQLFHQEAYVFGTRVDLTVYGDSQEQAEAAMAAVLQEFDRLHHALHAWQPSEVTRLNEALAQGEPAEVSEELAMLLADATEIAERGDELFDPALGRLIALWGFHDEEFEPELPDADALETVLEAHPRMSDLTIDGTTVSTANPAVQIDLGGYAKGYALDRAAAILREMGVDNALINIGGNVMALGGKGDAPWRIGIQHPREPRPLATLPLYDGEAIGTSGDYQRFFEIDGERYSHLLDPRTGYPAEGTQALTVLVTPRERAGTWSDAASKSPFISGDDWLSYLRAYDIEHGLRVADDGRIEVTREMRARLQIPSGVGPMRVID